MNPQFEPKKVNVSFADNHQENFVLVPFRLFEKIQQEKLELQQAIKRQKELAKTLEIIQQGEKEYQTGTTSTGPLSSLIS